MVQVDVFWAYGIGAGFGLASLREKTPDSSVKSLSLTPSFRDTLLYQALIFVPSGMVLLWCFPSWETMHAGSRELPGWLIALFAVTNCTQGLLGYFVARKLAAAGKTYQAYLHWLGGYFGIFFILVHGWDGTGYKRFFSPTREALDGWTWSTAGSMFGSPVGLTLMVMGVFAIPPILWFMSRWLAQGQKQAGIRGPSQGALALSVYGVTQVGVLGFAIAASALIHQLGWIAGSLVFAALAWLVGLRKGGLLHRHYRHLVHGDPLLALRAPSLKGAASI
jgi:hypothetical protein